MGITYENRFEIVNWFKQALDYLYLQYALLCSFIFVFKFVSFVNVFNIHLGNGSIQIKTGVHITNANHYTMQTC